MNVLNICSHPSYFKRNIPTNGPVKIKVGHILRLIPDWSPESCTDL